MLQARAGNAAVTARVQCLAEAPAQCLAPPPRHVLLDLQRAAGNAAVSWAFAPKLQRYGTGEHAQMGGARTVMLHGLPVTESELLTMGDLYLTPEDMMADKRGFPQILTLVRQDANFRNGVPGARKVGDKEWEAATAHMPKGKQYVDLAADNDTHFAPYPGETAKGDNRREWLKWHMAAIDKTVEHAKKGNKGVPEEAVALNGFGGHFLTDAFAAGHILAKQEIKDFAAAKAKKLGADETLIDWPFPESSFSVAVAEKLLVDPKAGTELRKYLIRIVQWGGMSVTKLSEAIYHIQEDEPDLYYGAFALIVHDKLNESIRKGSAFGPLEVDNDRGTTWMLAGDGTLAESPQTKVIARQAVEQSYDNLVQVANNPAKVDLGALYHAVWDYVPHPTVKGQAMIDKVLTTFADPARKETQQAVADFLVDNIEFVITKLRARDRLMTPAELRRRMRKADLRV